MKLSRLVGLALGAGCLVLAGIGALLLSGIGTRVGGGGTRSAPTPDRPLLAAASTPEFELAEQEAYAEIAQRPLFNEDRRPDPEDEIVEDGGGPEGPEGAEAPEVPEVPLQVTVRGIIITPEMKLALVTDPKTNSTLRLAEGMPLEGEMAAWTLAEIHPRRLVFDGATAGEAEVELEVHSSALTGGPPVRNRAVEPAADAGAEDEVSQSDPAAAAAQRDAEARAEEIRRRVAERRAQLRAEAERRRQQQDEEED